MNILNVTALIRHDFIDGKKAENPILFDIDREFQKSIYGVNFSYLYLHPYSNNLLGLIKKKWKQYNFLTKNKSFSTMGFYIYTFPIFILPFKTAFNGLLFRLSTYIYRKRIDRIVKKFEPVLIQAQDVDQSAYIANYIFKKYNIPYVLIPRGIQFKRFSYINNNIASAAAIICHGYSQLRPIKLEFENKIQLLIPHGVKDNFFIRNHKPSPPSKEIKIISIGRLLKLKNFDILIKVISKLDDIKLDIYGDGIERNNLNSLIENLHIGHRVKLITKPFVNHDLPVLFKNYDLFALVSFPETFGRVFAEAIVSGLPIIGAKETGIYGQVKDGYNGFFVDVKDANELERLLLYIQENPQILKEAAENNLKIRKMFSWNKILGQYYTLYESLIEKRNEE